MRRRAVAVMVGLSCGLSLPVVSHAAARPTASMACVHAVIGGHKKCLARGEYCARRYERQYVRYGFTCTKLDRRGRWHLQ
jgi:hypothetical protein